MKHFILFTIIIFLSSCTENARAKRFGGTIKYELDEGRKFENVTWKGEELWILTTEMEESHTPKTYVFEEKSRLGIVEGKVMIIERRKEGKAEEEDGYSWDKVK